MLQKHPLVATATATAIAAARHSPLATTTTMVAPWLHCHRLHRHRIVIGTAVTPVFPPHDLFDCYAVVSPPLYCHAFSSFFTHFITISPLVPPSFVDCCFKRRTNPLLPTMVSLLSSRPSALVGCFHCLPPLTLAASHGSRCQQSIALTAGTLTSPSPCPPLVIATPLAVLPLCGVFQTLAAQLAAWPYNPPPLG